MTAKEPPLVVSAELLYSHLAYCRVSGLRENEVAIRALCAAANYKIDESRLAAQVHNTSRPPRRGLGNARPAPKE